MSPPEPSPGDADTALTVSRNHVVVTGAGFTRALVPGAPLLVDDFSNDVLEARVRGLPNASRLLDWVSVLTVTDGSALGLFDGIESLTGAMAGRVWRWTPGGRCGGSRDRFSGIARV